MCIEKKEKLFEVISLEMSIKQEDIDLDKNLIDDLGLDSLDLVELVMAVEEEFAVSLDDSEFDKCKTVSDLLALVEKSA